MSTRTFEELDEAANHARNINDEPELRQIAEDLAVLGTAKAMAVRAYVLGLAAVRRSNFSEALEHFHQAMAMHEERADSGRAARVAISIGNVHYYTGNNSQALQQWQSALAIFEELGERDGVASITGNIGNVHSSTGNYPLALEYYHRALAMHEDLDNRSGLSVFYGGIGNVHTATGNYPLALEFFHRALAIHEEFGDRRGVARVYGNIGTVHASTDNHSQALEYYNRALALYEETGQRDGAVGIIGNVGNIYLHSGNYSLALEHYHRALAMYEELGNHSGVVKITCDIAYAHVKAGSFAEAEGLLATLDAMQIDQPGVAIGIALSRASIQEHHGMLDDAMQTLRGALATAQEHSLLHASMRIHMQMRDLCQTRNDLAGYVEHNNAYTRITGEIRGRDITTKLAMQEKQREIEAVQREHQRYMSVLHSTLPKHIADRVARGEVVNDSFDNAAVLFLDIVGFTTHSSQLDASTVVSLLEMIFTTFDVICADHDVMKIKTIGDSYMAVAFPEAENTHVHHAASVALAMMSSTFSWPHNSEQVMFRIGIHTGPVVAGVLGTARMQYDVWGDTVNVASRMESTSEPGRIHVSESFANHIRDVRTDCSPGIHPGDPEIHPHDPGIHPGDPMMKVTPRGVIDVKGKGTMQTYWLEGL